MAKEFMMKTMSLPGACCMVRSCSHVPLQNQVKSALKSNWPRIVIGFFEVSLYCALYHHATEEIKKRTKHRRWAALLLSPRMPPSLWRCHPRL